ncbi:SprT family zinc-dependent metalloprotease [Sulfuriflexus sp.]|uniref:M48 family metallopeptidase n=1 Tax=Sulfuriflexus sp. TaxID=2015443 RepID=UPI0028CC835B|nr:SprT family zinc-dependent metalloprotease [Sulfuriflexus sp.]MDT8405217.1 SprT family zinc-dependent metalloprotease [Sulfuriflexus sp.]
MSLFSKIFSSPATKPVAAPLPEYRVRVSARAKYVRLRLTPHDGLEVVIPKGFDDRKVPGILKSRREWLERALQNLPPAEARNAREDLPATIAFPATGQTWPVDYIQSDSSRVSATTRDGRLRLIGNIPDGPACQAALRRWLLKQAHLELVPWLESLSRTHSLPYQQARVRMQKTRWGSCSSRGTISINAQLLFLEKRHVEYVFLHELCHTRHLNHSPQFWAMLEELESAYKDIHQAMRQAWRVVPAWTSDRY